MWKKSVISNIFSPRNFFLFLELYNEILEWISIEFIYFLIKKWLRSKNFEDIYSTYFTQYFSVVYVHRFTFFVASTRNKSIFIHGLTVTSFLRFNSFWVHNFAISDDYRHDHTLKTRFLTHRVNKHNNMQVKKE